MIVHHAVLALSLDSLDSVIGRQSNINETEVYVFPQRVIGIDEARTLIDEAMRTPRVAPTRLLVVEVDSMTIEAQNALLKLLEEPPVTARFLFILRESVFVLPTLRSRFLIEGDFGLEPSVSFSEFLALSVPERIRLVAERMDKTKDEAWISQIRLGLRSYVLQRGLRGSDARTGRLLAYILAKLGTRGSSPKMLFEELAFTLPVEQTK